ncbi:MAG: hypothetical protein MJ134_00435 [Lachnospiraceae bacterium]|nr:hypothetical protein [Lachnospiraceae bacterium]
MTQDYEQEINLIDLLGYMICRWKWLVAGLILGGLIGGVISFCTPQHVLDEKYNKANSKLSEEAANGIKLLYDNFQLLQQEQKLTIEELEGLRQLKEQKREAEVVQQEIIEKEQLLIERTAAVSDYFTKNIRVLTGDQKAYYEALAESNGQGEDVSDEMQRSAFRTQYYRKTILIGVFAGTFLILLGIGVAYLLGNKVRTGEDFAAFSGSILLADFSAIAKEQKPDFLTKWGYKLRGMHKKSTEDVMLLATEYVESLIVKTEVKTLYIVTDDKINDSNCLGSFKEKMQRDTLQIVNGNFMNQPEKFEDMSQADGVLLWVCRDQSEYRSWEGMLIALNALEKRVIGNIIE